MTEGGIRQPLRHQRCHGDEGTVACGKLAFPAPNLTEKNIIIELCELRRKFTKHISACCNFSHTHYRPSPLTQDCTSSLETPEENRWPSCHSPVPAMSASKLPL